MLRTTAGRTAVRVRRRVLAAGAVSGSASVRYRRLAQVGRSGSASNRAWLPGPRVIGAVAASTPRARHDRAQAARPDVRSPRTPEAVSTPGSSVYRDYLTPEQFAQRFGASASELAAVTASLRATACLPDRSAPTTCRSGSPEARRRSSTRSRSRSGGWHSRAAGGRSSASAAPALDPPDRRRRAGGNRAQLAGRAPAAECPAGGPAARGDGRGSRPAPSRASPRADRSHAQAASSAAASQGAFTADQIASAYRFSGLFGAGARGPGQDDRHLRARTQRPGGHRRLSGAATGRTRPCPTSQVDGGAGSGPGVGEAALDIEQVIGLAPKANLVVYQAPNANVDSPGSGPYDLYSQIVSDDRAQVVSVSWGSCEQQQGVGERAAPRRRCSRRPRPRASRWSSSPATTDQRTATGPAAFRIPARRRRPCEPAVRHRRWRHDAELARSRPERDRLEQRRQRLRPARRSGRRQRRRRLADLGDAELPVGRGDGAARDPGELVGLELWLRRAATAVRSPTSPPTPTRAPVTSSTGTGRRPRARCSPPAGRRSAGRAPQRRCGPRCWRTSTHRARAAARRSGSPTRRCTAPRALRTTRTSTTSPPATTTSPAPTAGSTARARGTTWPPGWGPRTRVPSGRHCAPTRSESTTRAPRPRPSVSRSASR